MRRPNSRVLLVLGDRDEFTAIASYDKWSNLLQQLCSSDVAADGSRRLQVVRVDGASHFWGGRTLRALITTVEDFLR